MKTLYIQCNMGVAGDMLMAALSELVDQDVFLNEMNNLGLEDVHFEKEKSEKSGICGTNMHVLVHGEEEGEHHDHDHHHHTQPKDIEEIIQGLNTTPTTKENALAVYKLLAEAESKVHGEPVEEIHFHEVGNKDAIADIVGVSRLIEMIGADRIVASPVAVGSGTVKCAHGILPVPAPATALLLEGIPSYAGEVEGELCTPTGAALLKHFVETYSAQPLMKVEKVGYGVGKKDFPVANVVRAFIGEDNASEKIIELVCNIDDQSAEEIGYAIDVLFDNGALDVFTTPVNMKKNRPGILFTCVTSENKKEEMLKLMFENLSTIGIREYATNRYALDRHIEEVETSLGTVHKKVSSGYGITKEKYEFEDLSKISKETGKSIKDIKKVIEEEKK